MMQGIELRLKKDPGSTQSVTPHPLCQVEQVLLRCRRVGTLRRQSQRVPGLVS